MSQEDISVSNQFRSQCFEYFFRERMFPDRRRWRCLDSEPIRIVDFCPGNFEF